MNWIQTRAGLQMAQIIIKYLPRITVCLERIANSSELTKTGGNNERSTDNKLEAKESL